MSVQFETFGGNPIQPAYPGGINLSLTGNISLSWPIQFQNTNNIVYNYMNITPNANGHVITMPDATLASSWQSFIVNNPSAFSFTINKFDGTLLYTSNAGTTEYIILTNNTTQAGTWLTSPFAAGGSAVTSINMTSSSNNVVIGGVPITSAGTITLALANDLLALTSFGASTGIPARTAANTWALRQIVGTNNQIAVTNPFGIAGNPTLSLATNITGINSITVGDINIATDVISTQNLNENLYLEPNGTGLVVMGGGGAKISAGVPLYFYADNDVNYMSIEGGAQTVNYSLIWPTVAPMAGQVLLYNGANQLAWANVTTFGGPSTINAIARYSTTFGSLENSTVLISNAGDISGINSIEIGAGPNIQIGGTGGNLPNTIETLNVNGNLYLTCNGTGEVQSSGPLATLNGSPFKFYDGLGNYISLQVGAIGQTIQYTMPATVPGLNQVWATSSVGTPATFINTYMPSNRNILYNGGFLVWQRGTTFTNATYYPNNNLQYCADRWKILSNGNDIASVSRVAGPTGPLITAYSAYAWQFTVTTGAAKFGLCQILPYSDSVDLVGNQVVFNVTAQGVGTTNFKFAVIGWTGAADAPTTNPIAAWNATGTSPTLVANWAYQGVPTAVNLTGAYTTYTTGPITIGAGVTNIGVFLWCDSTAGVAGNSIALTCCSLTAGPLFMPYYPDSFSFEILRAKRFFQKDFPYSVAPGTTGQASTRGIILVSSLNTVVNVPSTASVTVIYATIDYEVEMFNGITPTVVVYPWTTVANTNRVSNNTGADLAANTGVVGTPGTILDSLFRGFTLQNTSGANATTTGFFLMHYTVQSEF